MFEKFFEYVGIENNTSIDDVNSFLKEMSGRNFKQGIYRIHNYNELQKWTKIVESIQVI